MLLLHDRATMERALTLDLDPRLTEILQARVEHTLATGLADDTEILVVAVGDTELDIGREVGFSPLVEPIDGARYDQPGFAPYWDRIADLGGWFEVLTTFGSTFALILLVEDADGVLTELRAMCRRYAAA